MKILIVDDDVTLLGIINESLLMEGYETKTATNGLEAIEILKHFKADIVLSDIRMPVCDGYQFLERLKDITPSPVPIVFMSGYGGEENNPLSKNPIVKKMISKPFDISEFILVIKNLVKSFPNKVA